MSFNPYGATPARGARTAERATRPSPKLAARSLLRNSGPGLGGFVSLCEQRIHGCTKLWQVLLDASPDQVVLHDGIAVDQDIPQSDDLPKMWDPGTDLRGDLVELIECLADNLQLPLDGRVQQRVRRVVRRGLVADERCDVVGGLTHIPEEGAWVTRHTPSCDSVRCPRAGRDCSPLPASRDQRSGPEAFRDHPSGRSSRPNPALGSRPRIQPGNRDHSPRPGSLCGQRTRRARAAARGTGGTTRPRERGDGP